jgi:hypothetical protein
MEFSLSNSSPYPGLVQSIVILYTPQNFVMVIALYCLGLLSRVYGTSQSQKLSPAREFRGFAARK